jgi:hypothetical protein
MDPFPIYFPIRKGTAVKDRVVTKKIAEVRRILTFDDREAI